uniref:Uncharacterized protein n=1 Tax=mine drainage metagenome TaxID=410659 RepID=E6QXB1_9ZZZZ
MQTLDGIAMANINATLTRGFQHGLIWINTLHIHPIFPHEVQPFPASTTRINALTR